MDRSGATWSRIQPRLLRIAVSLCFFCHGIWAIKCATVYHSEWNVWIQHLLGFTANPFLAARIFLTTIGIIDIIAAIALILPQPPAIAYLWVILWGTATAFSRLYFLSSFKIDVLQGVIYPLTHTLVRVANFAIPFLAWRILQGDTFRGYKLPSAPRIYALVVGASTIAIALRYIIIYFGPEYPYKLYMMGQSLWVFHGAGALAWAAVFAFIINTYVKNLTTQRCIAWMIFASLLLTELITISFLHLPHGPGYVLIKMGERATVYMAISGWIVTHRADLLCRSLTQKPTQVATATA